MLSLPAVTMQSRLLTFFFVRTSWVLYFLNLWCFMYSSLFLRISLFTDVYKRCPAFVNTLNYSHEFIQLRLVLNPALFTNSTLVVLLVNVDVQVRSTFFPDSQVSELQITEQCVTKLNDSQQTYCRTDKLPNRAIVKHSAKCWTYFIVTQMS
jgi:hypothetical protein